MSYRWLGSLLGLSLGALLSVTCGPPAPVTGNCRYDPHCAGGLGAFCDKNADCFSGHCCGKDSCGGGMCTYKCDNDAQCPAGMLCDGGTCYFSCAGPTECANGQDCTKQDVCHW